MVDVKKLLVKIIEKLKVTPAVLDNNKYEATQLGTSYEWINIDNMSSYNVIAVYFVVHEMTQLCYFVRGVDVDISLTDVPAAGRFRGTVRVDWAQEAVGIRAVNAGTAGTRYDLVYFKGVYGIA